MNLSDKLRRFVSENKEPERPPLPSNLNEILSGREVRNDEGVYYLVENRYPLTHRHGIKALGDVFKCNSEGLAFLAKDSLIKNVNLEKVVFLDTETTGLAGGAGTYAFLIGVGFFAPGEFVLKQFFMRDYHEEFPMLQDLWQLLQDYQTIVTFNGKSFDWPLIKDRLIMTGQNPMENRHIHLDLLYPARRLWGRKLVNCSLNSLEANVLQVQRVNDIPGFEVPQRYFNYLQTKKGELVKDILQHNFLDILSMVTLLAYYGTIVKKKPKSLFCAWECYALAYLYEQNRDWNNAIEYYRRVIELNQQSYCSRLSLSRLGLIYRRMAKWDLAEEIWISLVDEVRDIQSCEELAKYYEHIKKDYQLARRAVKEGLSLALSHNKLRVTAFRHRLQRLERKIEKAMEG